MAKGQAVTKEELIAVLFDFHKEVEEPMTEKILTRLDKIEGRLGEVEGRLGEVEDGLEEVKIEVKNEVGRLERKLDQVTDHQARVLDNHQTRIARVEAVI